MSIACKKTTENNDFSRDSYTGHYSHGTYCAEVKYYNPNAGTSGTYKLDVEVEDSYLIQINWPSEGWLDKAHFTSVNIKSGSCSISSDRRVEYTVTLLSKGGGCGSGHDLQRDVNKDTVESSCPDCGGDKYSWQDYCNNCKYERLEKLCPMCGGDKGDYDDYCSSCEEDVLMYF
ncbi:acetyl-CoA carboxylase [Myroides pelagicus]|uniref:acetyl-CoA carboxylase n=1 Tax=Myroides pelagicus TaxID=270914 RepID=UPI002DB663AC|nr:acetyl-CoA carboxylase [Myroides pelagicus]MEC4114072.1 acetyl-CoA carboxylase [Myroides pelagicus]